MIRAKLIISAISCPLIAILLSSCSGSGVLPTSVSIATPYPTSTPFVLPTHVPPGSPAPQGDQLFLSDFDTGIIERVDLSSLGTTVVLTGLNKPEDGTCNSNGQVFFAEPAAQQIIRFNPDGSDLTTVLDPSSRTPEGQEFYPEGPSFDSSGNLFFNTSGTPFMPHPHTGVYEIAGADPHSKPVRVVPTFTQHGEGTAFLPTGELLAADWTNGRIIKSDPPDYGLGGVFASHVPSAHGLAVANNGDVFISEGGDVASGATSRIFHYDAKGDYLGVYATLNEVARHIELDSADNLYVGTITGGVYMINPHGGIARIAKGRHVSGLAICKTAQGR